MKSGRLGASTLDATPGQGRGVANLPVLDGVRGLAVLLVLAFHFVFGSPDISHGAWSGEFLRKLTYVGWTGVDLFFVLSGFLITRILLNAKHRQGYFQNFYARRVLRIFPLYYATLVFMLILLPALSDAWAQQVRERGRGQVYLWTYTLNIATLVGRGDLGVLDFGHFWSLCVEEHFYVFWPLLVWFFGIRGLRQACVFLVLTAIACRIGFRMAGMRSTPIFYFTLCRMDSLAMGAWVATWAVDASGVMRALPPSSLRRALLVGMSALAAESVIIALDHGALRGGAWSQSIGFTVIAVFWASLIVVAMCSRAEGRLPRALCSRPMRAMGKYSYGLYVFHPLIHSAVGPWVISAATFLMIRTGSAANLLGLLFIFVVLTAISFVVAFLVYQILERPCLGLKRFFESKPIPASFAPSQPVGNR